MAVATIIDTHPGANAFGIVICVAFDPNAFNLGQNLSEIHIAGFVRYTDAASGKPVFIPFNVPVAAGTLVPQPATAPPNTVIAQYPIPSNVASPKVGTPVSFAIAFGAFPVSGTVNTDP